MKVRYTEGPAVLAVDEVGRVERGKAVEVSKEVGEKLVSQGWTKVGGSSKSKKTTSSKSKKPAATSSEPNTSGLGPEKGD